MTRWQLITVAAVLAAQAHVSMATPAFARVLEVDPVYAPVGAPVARRHCWKERDHADKASAFLRRCTRVYTLESRREQVGYRVKYWYQGRVCRTQTEGHPGQRIRVHHDLQPIHF